MATSFFARLINEPLIQFLIIALFIFAADSYVLGNKEDPRRIVIDDTRLQELIDIFREGQGRDPSADEINNIVVKWSQNEILYREARLMGMDAGDDMIRSRLVLKMRNVLFNRVMVDSPSEDELSGFFKFNQENYQTPERYDFEQFLLPSGTGLGEGKSLADKLADQGTPERYQSKFREYSQRPLTNLEHMFTTAGAQQLIQAPTNRWVPLQSSMGVHLARIIHIHPGQETTLDDNRSQVIRDWKKFRNDIQLADQTKAIADKYSIKLELSPKMAARLDSNKVRLSSALHQSNTSGVN